jgi:hypothetical protein
LDHRIDQLRLAAACLALVLLLVACGTSAPSRPAVCRRAAQDAIANDLSVNVATIAYGRSVGDNDMPQCEFAVRDAGKRISVLVNVDDGPQVYFRLLRTVVEASQIFGAPPPGFHPPQGISGLGPYASWFPNSQQLMATNDQLLLTATVDWPGASRNAKVALAKAAVVPYLVRVSRHVSQSVHGYP